jgi:hypothetical protein
MTYSTVWVQCTSKQNKEVQMSTAQLEIFAPVSFGAG